MTTMSGDSSRIHYLDNLRALAMLAGVYLHGALAYAEPSRSVWVATDPNGSVMVDASIWWIHLFRMSLFFLLSGYFANLLIQRRGQVAFLWNRTLRIGLPFLLFYFPLWLAMMIVFGFAISYVKQPEGLLRFIIEAGRNPESKANGLPWSTMHLWFLYYLAMFSLVAVMVRSLSGYLDLFRRERVADGQVPTASALSLDGGQVPTASALSLSAGRSGRFESTLQRFFGCPWLLLLMPLLLVPGVMGGGVPLSAPESFIPTWWPFLYYGLFYAAGWQLYGREGLLDRMQPWCWPLLGLSFLLFLPYYRLLPVLDVGMIQQAKVPLSAGVYLFECVLTAYLSVLLTISALLVGQRLLLRSNGWLKFCADSSYWVYLLHLPVVFFLQTLLIPASLSMWVKLWLVVIGAWLFCLATYVVFVRYTPVGWMLHGKRAFP